jgi:hypothetical protein
MEIDRAGNGGKIQIETIAEGNAAKVIEYFSSRWTIYTSVFRNSLAGIVCISYIAN